MHSLLLNVFVIKKQCPCGWLQQHHSTFVRRCCPASFYVCVTLLTFCVGCQLNSGLSTQQWPNARITLFEKTRQSAWLDTEATPVDKKRVNSCVLNHPLFWGSSATKNPPRTLGNALSDVVLMSRFQKPRRAVFWDRTSRGFNWSINSRPKILRCCLLHCTCPEWIRSEGVYFRAQNGRQSKDFRVLCQKTNKQTNKQTI